MRQFKYQWWKRELVGLIISSSHLDSLNHNWKHGWFYALLQTCATFDLHSLTDKRNLATSISLLLIKPCRWSWCPCFSYKLSPNLTTRGSFFATTAILSLFISPAHSLSALKSLLALLESSATSHSEDVDHQTCVFLETWYCNVPYVSTAPLFFHSEFFCMEQWSPCTHEEHSYYAESCPNFLTVAMPSFYLMSSLEQKMPTGLAFHHDAVAEDHVTICYTTFHSMDKTEQ